MADLSSSTSGISFTEDPHLLSFYSKGLKTDKLPAHVFEIDEDAKDEVSREARLLSDHRHWSLQWGGVVCYWITGLLTDFAMPVHTHWCHIMAHDASLNMSENVWLQRCFVQKSLWLMVCQSCGQANSVTSQRLQGSKTSSLTCSLNSLYWSASPCPQARCG